MWGKKSNKQAETHIVCVPIKSLALFPLIEYVMENWEEDFMFGYQFLNGCNPVMIRKCTNLPDGFAVTQEMVKDSLDRGLTLQEELKVRR